MTREQAMAFVEVIVKSPKPKSHVDAVLGYGNCPEMDDWSSKDERSIERCDGFIGVLEEAAGVLRAIQETRERQVEIPLEEKPRRGRKDTE